MRSAIVSNQYGSYGSHQVVCPFCKEQDYVHPEMDAIHVGHSDDYESPLGNRGDWLEIPMWCESDHRFRLVLGFHKGMTFVGALKPAPS